MQLQADGHTGYTCSSDLFEQLFGEGDFASPSPNDPFECWRNGNIEQALRPLTPQQIASRFGDVQGQEEAETMLLELLEKGNATIRATVTTDIPTSGNGSGRRFVSWSGLVTYFEL